jgi:hypothetical protein
MQLALPSLPTPAFSPLGSGPPAGTATAATRPPVAVAGVAPDTDGGPAAGAASAAGTRVRGAVRSWDPQRNAAVAGGQQALAYLAPLASQLQGLKADLSARLAAGSAPGAQQDQALQDQLQRVATTWRNRQLASGGSLDGQLRYTSPPQPTQRFSVRGLNLATLQSGDKETLSLAVNAPGQQVASVGIEPGMSATEIVQRFNQALAPAQVQASVGDSGALVFSVAASAWPAVRDSLSIKGGGVRFPAGQLVRVRADPEPEAMQPEAWSADDADSTRRSLQGVTRALALTQNAQTAASLDIAAASSRLEAARPAEDAAWAASAAAQFQAAAAQPGYAAVSSMAAALTGLGRGQVQALLTLPPSLP